MNIVSFLIIVIILIVFIVISLFIEEFRLKLAYWLVVVLFVLSITNMYMSIVYYIKLREDPGIPGPRGAKGDQGPSGDIGKCTFSDKCGIENCEEKIYNIASDYYSSIPLECLKDNTKCNENDAEKALPITNQINMLIEECKKTQTAESDFILRITPVIANMENSN